MSAEYIDAPKEIDWSSLKDISIKLLQLLGEDAYEKLVSNYGGLRMYVPHPEHAKQSELVDAITLPVVQKLSQAIPGLYIKIPLDREFLTTRYIAYGFSNRRIATLLRMTETGVEVMKKRLRKSGKISVLEN